jgi:hypothetical protein
MRSRKWIVLAAASTALLWGATRVNLGQVRGNGPGLLALSANNRAMVATVGSGLTLDVGTGSLSANAAGTIPQVAVHHAASGQTVFNLPSRPLGAAAPKVVLVYRNGLLQAATDDYTMAANGTTVTMLEAAGTDGEDTVQILAYY